MVVPDKVQMAPSFAFLGFSIAKQDFPLSYKLEMKEQYIFSDL